jgi:hypothetical protein
LAQKTVSFPTQSFFTDKMEQCNVQMCVNTVYILYTCIYLYDLKKKYLYIYIKIICITIASG